MSSSFIIKGNLCQTTNSKELDLHENAYAVCVDGISRAFLPICRKNMPPYRFTITVML